MVCRGRGVVCRGRGSGVGEVFRGRGGGGMGKRGGVEIVGMRD